MPTGGLDAETLFKPRQPLRRQRNFRNHNQHLPPVFKRFCHRLKINFRLAGTGHAVNQRHRKSLPDLAVQHIRRRLLLVRQFDLGKIAARHAEITLALHHHRFQHPGVNHGFNHRLPHTRALRNFRPGIGIMPQQVHHPPARVRIFQLGFGQRLTGELVQRHGFQVVKHAAHAQHHFQHQALKRHIIRGHEIHKFHQFCRQRRKIDTPQNRLDFAVIQL